MSEHSCFNFMSHAGIPAGPISLQKSCHVIVVVTKEILRSSLTFHNLCGHMTNVAVKLHSFGFVSAQTLPLEGKR